jgi:nucleotide-binding universal stress UspA family protein
VIEDAQRPYEEPEMRRIVVGVDGSRKSIQAVAFAGRLATETGAGLTVVFVRHIPPGYYGPPLEVESAELERHYRLAEQRVARRVVKALTPPTVPWDLEVGSGEVAEEVQRVARERGADLIVVGTRRQGPIGRLLGGSVSTRVVHHADRPVLVVR